jgi:hypothetical protein
MGRRIDPRPKVTGIEIPQRSSLLPYWEGQSGRGANIVRLCCRLASSGSRPLITRVA